MRRYALIFALILAGVGLDRWTKMLAAQHLRGQSIRDVAGSFFQLVFVENTGAFLSFGADLPDTIRLIALTILPTALLLGLLGYTLFSSRLNTWQVIAFSFICSGGMSNLYDRITEGKVIDFMIMGIGPLRTGVFNTADVCIMTGLFMMLPSMLGFGERRRKQEEEQQESA